MKNKSIKKLLSSFLMISMLLLTFSATFTAAAASKSDIKGHWAESQISAWIDLGYIKGYEDGSFKPENSITRAEFIALINRSFGFSEEATISFSDVATSNWAYTEVAKAVKAGFVIGNEDGTFGVNKFISRQEVAVIVNRLLGLSNSSTPASFIDDDKIALWAKDAVDAAVANNILNGYSIDNSFKPVNPITRAEAVVTLDRAIAPKVVVYDTPGTYGPATGMEIVNKDVVINASGVILQNMTLNGKLTFAAGIGSGVATLKNVTVKGETIVQGGGVNSIHLENSVLAAVTVDKSPTLGSVRIVAEGTTTVNQVNVNSPVALQETNATGAGFGNVKLTNLLPAGSKVTLKGTFDNLEVVGSKISLDIPEGSVQKVTAAATSTGLTIDLSKDAKIVSLILDAAAKILGSGTIDSAMLSAIAKAGSTFETQPTKTVVASTTATPTPTPTTIPTATPTATPTPTPIYGTPTPPTVLAAPTSLVATVGNSQIHLNWKTVTGATYYNVYQSLNGTNYTLISTPVTSTAATYDVTGLTNDTLYYFKTNAANTVSESTYSNVVSLKPLVGLAPVNLGTAGNYVTLAKTGISSVPNSVITGDIGVSPAAASYITGFSLSADATNLFSTSSQITGKVYASTYASPTSSNLTNAVSNMETAYTDAAGRAAGSTELYAGNLSGKTLTAGVYKWGNDVSINTDVTLNGGLNDVFIFQIAKGITQASGTRIILTGGVQAKNIFWQAAETVSIGTGAHFEGIILGKKNISMGTNASINGRLLAQTAVTLDHSTVVAP
jgi:hypothetical protein